jgi:hypothetical protein
MQRMYDRCQRFQVNGMTRNFNAHVVYALTMMQLVSPQLSHLSHPRADSLV